MCKIEICPECQGRISHYFEECAGCPDGHSSFWKTVIESPQWQLWRKEQDIRMGMLGKGELPEGVMCYDMAEVEEGGIISQKHFQDFIKFITYCSHIALIIYPIRRVSQYQVHLRKLRQDVSAIS